MNDYHEVIIKCEGAGTIELDDLLAIQGRLKSLAPEDKAKLMHEITGTGFAFPFSLWREPGATGERQRYILDGHQRLVALVALREEMGWIIPPLPYVWVDADTKQEALKRVLQVSSQYGRMTADSLRPFLDEAGVQVEEYQERFRLPEVYMLDARTPLDIETDTAVAKKAQEEHAAKAAEVTCPECGHIFTPSAV